MAEKIKRKNVRGEGSVFQRGDGSWEARYQNRKYNGGKPISRRAVSKKEAYQKLEAIKHQLFGGVLADGTINATVKEYLLLWVKTTKHGVIKAQSVDRIESIVNTHIIPKFGNYLMSSLCFQDIQGHMDELYEAGKSYSTIKKVYDVLNSCCKRAVMIGDLKKNPAYGITLRKQSKRDRKIKKNQIPYYTPEEVDRLIEAATSSFKTGRPCYRMGWAIPFVINTGIRIGELSALQWKKHVDLDKREVIIENTQITVKDQNPDAKKKYIIKDQGEPKSESGFRNIKLNNDAYEALKKLHEVTGNGKYVVSAKTGGPIAITHLDRMMKKICKAAGFSEDRMFGMHALRHTFASKLFAKGVDVKMISALLGHSSVKVTSDIYIHIISNWKNDALFVPDNL